MRWGDGCRASGLGVPAMQSKAFSGVRIGRLLSYGAV